jgi:hypothetical protein
MQEPPAETRSRPEIKPALRGVLAALLIRPARQVPAERAVEVAAVRQLLQQRAQVAQVVLAKNTIPRTALARAAAAAAVKAAALVGLRESAEQVASTAVAVVVVVIIPRPQPTVALVPAASS